MRKNSTLEKTGSRRYHLAIDICKANCPRETLDNKPFLEQLLQQIVESIDMQIIGGPYSLDGVPENPGSTSIAIMDTSNSGIHTFTDENDPRDEICVDVFSCKPFDTNTVTKKVLNAFQTTAKNVRRTINFPDQITYEEGGKTIGTLKKKSHENSENNDRESKRQFFKKWREAEKHAGKTIIEVLLEIMEQKTISNSTSLNAETAATELLTQITFHSTIPHSLKQTLHTLLDLYPNTEKSPINVLKCAIKEALREYYKDWESTQKKETAESVWDSSDEKSSRKLSDKEIRETLRPEMEIKIMSTEDLKNRGLLSTMQEVHFKEAKIPLVFEGISEWIVAFDKKNEKLLGFLSLNEVDEKSYAFLLEDYPTEKSECETALRENLNLELSTLIEATNFAVVNKIFKEEIIARLYHKMATEAHSVYGIDEILVVVQHIVKRIFNYFQIKQRHIADPKAKINVEKTLERMSRQASNYYDPETERPYLEYGNPRGITISMQSILDSPRIKSYCN